MPYLDPSWWQVAASFLAAFATFAAVVVALRASRREHQIAARQLDQAEQFWTAERGERADKIRLRGQALAIVLHPALLLLKGSLVLALEGRDTLEDLDVPPPSALEKYIHDYWMMGPAGGHILQLISILRTHHDIVRQWQGVATGVAFRNGEEEFRHLCRNRLSLALESCRDAIRSTNTLIDSESK